MTWGRGGREPKHANRRDHPTYAPRTMPRLRRTNAHHRDLQARAKATDPSATTKGHRMTRCPSECTIPAPVCASSGRSILLPQTIQYVGNAPMFIVINVKFMPLTASEPPQMQSTHTPRPKPTYSSLALAPEVTLSIPRLPP
jgi:hypothetical protein